MPEKAEQQLKRMRLSDAIKKAEEYANGMEETLNHDKKKPTPIDDKLHEMLVQGFLNCLGREYTFTKD